MLTTPVNDYQDRMACDPGDLGHIDAECLDIDAAVKPKKEAAMMTDNSSTNILVVDDEELIQDLLSSFLEAFGHQVTIAKNGLEALNSLAENEFSMVLMDVRMPEMDGLTATKFLRKCERGDYQDINGHSRLAQTLCSRRKGTRIPVVAVTANIDDREMMLQAGMDDFIPKPFNIDEILETLEKFCGENTENL